MNSPLVKSLLGLILVMVFLMLVITPSSPPPNPPTQTPPTGPEQTATTQGIIRHSYNLSLSDNRKQDFTDSLKQESGSEWGSSRINATGGSCLFTEGAYHVSQTTKNPLMNCLTSRTFSDFSFEVQLTLVQGDCGGVAFRADNNGNHYLFSICVNGSYSIEKYNESSPVMIILAKSSATINPNVLDSNKIAIKADGPIMKFYINEEVVAQKQDNSYISGSLGLIAHTRHNDPTEAAYSNAKLWTPLGPTTPTNCTTR